MTDDIVTRLLDDYAPHLKFGNHQDWCKALCIMEEAADEIERLRAELVRVLKPKDIWHDCSHCMGHEPSNNA